MSNQRAVYGNMLQEAVVNRMRALNEARTARIDAIKTKDEAEKYVQEVREKVQSCFPMPEDRSVPAAELCGVIERETFRIEKLIYFSRPNYPVTANLYVPAAPGKHPGVVFVCGHSGEGKSCSTYQYGAQNLALQGYVVLLIDPVSQGERWQFVDVPGAEKINGVCTSEHSMQGKQLRLCGEFLGAWRAYDALRGLDYLLSRSEVDPERIGITGNSGGGTMTTFVQALDSRFTMAAPSCYVTSWQRNFENELRADAEQMPPGILGHGCEMGDLLLAYAPRPILILGQKNDFFDARGLKETWENARKVYKLLGAEENLQYFIGPTNHGYSIENREAMYNFFGKHANIGSNLKESENTEIFEGKELWCTETGQLMTSRKEFSLLHDLLEKQALQYQAEKKKLSLDELKSEVRKMLQIPDKIDIPYSRHLGPWGAASAWRGEGEVPPERNVFSRFALEGERGVFSILKINAGSAYRHFPELDTLTLYLPHLEGACEVLELERGPEEIYAALDYRNIGETQAVTTAPGERYGHFSSVHDQDYHYDGVELMFGSSMIARRVLDVLQAVEYVKAHGIKHLHLIARGQGALPGAFAALLASDKVESLTLYDAPESYLSMVQKRVTFWPQSCMLPGFLKVADLPDVYSALEKVVKLDIVNFVSEPVPEE